MARLTHMRISKDRNPSPQHPEYALQLEWDNNRHQEVRLDDLKPESVMLGLHRLASVVGADFRNRKL